MGYVHDTHMSQFIPPAAIGKTAGTWTPAVASNVVTENRTAADANFGLLVPVMIPGNSSALKGARLKSVELMYDVSTGACDDVATVELERITVTAAGVASGAAVTTTVNGTEDTSAKRKAVAAHRVVVTVTTPEWVDNDVYYTLYVLFDPAANSVVKLYGAVANFDLRI